MGVSDPETLSVYARKAAEYAQRFGANRKSDEPRDTFIALVAPGGRVLDLGCGPGTSAAALAHAGLSVEAWDAVPEMVALAGQHEGVTAKQAVFSDLHAQKRYHGIWANFSLLHAPLANLPTHLAAISTALKPGGIFHIGMKTGEGEARDALGRRYSYVEPDHLRSLLREAGLEPTQNWTGQSPGLDGVDAPWVIQHAVKPLRD